MKKLCEYKKGDMFFFNPLEMDYMNPEVYVLMKDDVVQGRPARIFIKSAALVRFLLHKKRPTSSDTWAFSSDRYFESMTEKGHFIPIDDLREADELCEKFSLTMERAD